MKEYKVDCINKGVFSQGQKIQANSPKEAAEKAVGQKVRRVMHGGNIVVYAFCNGEEIQSYRSYVYEVLLLVRWWSSVLH